MDPDNMGFPKKRSALQVLRSEFLDSQIYEPHFIFASQKRFRQTECAQGECMYPPLRWLNISGTILLSACGDISHAAYRDIQCIEKEKHRIKVIKYRNILARTVFGPAEVSDEDPVKKHFSSKKISEQQGKTIAPQPNDLQPSPDK
jgi:hypothetical protein